MGVSLPAHKKNNSTSYFQTYKVNMHSLENYKFKRFHIVLITLKP